MIPRTALTITVEYDRRDFFDAAPSEVAEWIEDVVRERISHLHPTLDLAFPAVEADPERAS